MRNTQKIVSFADLQSQSVIWTGKKVLVGGCFDVLHIGHVTYLEAARQAGDFLIVALESDEFIQTRKKRQPFHNQRERAHILAALDCVDVVILLPLFSTDTEYSDLVMQIRPDIIAITENDPQKVHKEAQSKEVGGQVVVVTSYIPNKTSSDLMKAINKLD